MSIDNRLILSSLSQALNRKRFADGVGLLLMVRGGEGKNLMYLAVYLGSVTRQQKPLGEVCRCPYSFSLL
jgi:hypothetical protein